MNKPTDIRTMSLQEIEKLVAELGQPKFRSKQLYEWLHTHLAVSYDEMTNVPKALRQSLEEKFLFLRQTLSTNRFLAMVRENTFLNSRMEAPLKPSVCRRSMNPMRTAVYQSASPRKLAVLWDANSVQREKKDSHEISQLQR